MLAGNNGAAPLTPGLPPHELQAACGSKMLLDGVVDPLDEHAGQIGPLEQIRHCGAVTEGVYRPATAGGHTWKSHTPLQLAIHTQKQDNPVSIKCETKLYAII